MVDGAENNPPSFYLSRHYEVSKYYVLDEHTAVPDVILMSEQIWQSLTPIQQGWVRSAMRDSVVYQKQLWQAATLDALAQVKARGVEVIVPDKQPFIDAVQPLHQQLAGSEVGELLQKIQQLTPEVASE